MRVKIHCSCCTGTKGSIVYERLTSVYSSDEWNLARCDFCGNIMVTPPPSAESLHAVYEKTYLYDVHQLITSEKKYRARSLAKFIRRMCTSIQQPRLLEVGCMHGELLRELRNDFDVKGVEIGAAEVNYCTSQGLDVDNQSLEAFLTMSKEKFDVIVMVHVFEHIRNPDDALLKLREKLNPGGRIIICVPNSKSFCRKLFGRYWGWWQVPVHVNHFNIDALAELMTRRGFAIEKVRLRGGDSLMLLLNFINLFSFRHERPMKLGIFCRTVIKLNSILLMYWYLVSNEELTVVMTTTF